MAGKKGLVSSSAKKKNIIPVLFKLHVSENTEMAEKLLKAIVVENSNFINTELAKSSISSAEVPVLSMFSVSPTKLLLFFESDL